MAIWKKIYWVKKLEKQNEDTISCHQNNCPGKCYTNLSCFKTYKTIISLSSINTGYGYYPFKNIWDFARLQMIFLCYLI